MGRKYTRLLKMVESDGIMSGFSFLLFRISFNSKISPVTMYYFCYWGKKILKGIQECIPLITLFILFICWANSFYSQTGWNPQIPYL